MTTIRVDFSGPFFQRDPRKTVKDNIRTMLERLAEEGEADVKGQMESKAGSMPKWTGWSRDSVVGRVTSVGGKRWAYNMVISASTSGMSAKDAIRTQAAAASIERRWHPFRKTTSAMRRARAVLAANLTEGLE